MDIQGVIISLGETEQVGNNGFRKREFVVKTDEQYSQEIPIQFSQDRCDILNSYAVGDAVKVDYNLHGRAWVSPQGETKWFVTVSGWRISKLNTQSETGNSYQGQGSAVDDYQQRQKAQTNTKQGVTPPEEDYDDMPF